MNVSKILDPRHVQRAFSALMAAFLIGSVSYLGVRYYNSSSALDGATMSVTPDSGNLPVGSTISFTIRENSGSVPVNTAQASVAYNAAQLQFINITEGGAFPLVAATSTGQPGVIRIARGVQGQPVTGDKPLVTLNFKVLAAGTASVKIDKNFSAVVRSADNQNILASTAGGEYTLAAGGEPAAGTSPEVSEQQPVLTMTPTSGVYPKGATIPVAIRLNTHGANVNVVHGVIKIPPELLALDKIENTSTFPTATRDKVSGDTIDFTRGIAGGAKAVTGEHLVATVHLKVIGSAGSLPVMFTGSSEVFDDSGSGKNILNLLNSRGTLYSITGPNAGASNDNQNTSGQSGQIVRADGTLVIKPTGSGNAFISAGNNTQVAGSIELSPVANTEVLTANPGDEIVKAEYLLDKVPVATKTKAPFSYTFDTKKLKNGDYVMTVKTFYKSGYVDTNTDTLFVKNPVTLSYVAANYMPNILGTIIGLALIGFAVWKYLLPKFMGGRFAAPTGPPQPPVVKAMDPLPRESLLPTSPPKDDHIAPDPAVVTPNGMAADPNVVSDIDIKDTSGAVEATQPLELHNPQVLVQAAPQASATAAAPVPTTSARPAAPQALSAELQPAPSAPQALQRSRPAAASLASSQLPPRPTISPLPTRAPAPAAPPSQSQSPSAEPSWQQGTSTIIPKTPSPDEPDHPGGPDRAVTG